MRVMQQDRRGLTAFTFDVVFEASFVAEMAYEVDGTSYYGLVGLASEMSEEISASMSSGQFTELVRSIALAGGVVAMDEVNSASLVSLEIQDVTYLGTKELTVSYDSADEDLSSSSSTTRMSSEHMVAFISVVFLGLFALLGIVGIVVRARRSTDMVAQDPYPKMDQSTISNHLVNRKFSRVNVESSL